MPTSSKDLYAILELAPAASSEEIKASFRRLISRYHPDKVQHLGKEFQDLASERASELTEAYRVLSRPELREEYDQARTAGQPAAAPAAAAASVVPDGPAPDRREPPPVAEPEPAAPEGAAGHRFSRERATRDVFVRKATVDRVRQAFVADRGSLEEATVRGFDLAWAPRARFLGRADGPRILVRFVEMVDAAAVRDAWVTAASVQKIPGKENCILLMGMGLATASELGRAIADLRRQTRGIPTMLVPIDARDWHAHLPTDTPTMVRNLLARLKSGT